VASHKAILALGSGSFKLASGAVGKITIHLSARARRYLAKVHSLKTRVTITAKDQGGISHTTVAALTLRLAKR
jgi:hypothetical protein